MPASADCARSSASGETPSGFSFEASLTTLSNPNLLPDLFRRLARARTASAPGYVRGTRISAIFGRYRASISNILIIYRSVAANREMPKSKKDQTTGTLADRAYQMLKHGILHDEFPEGSFLRETEILAALFHRPDAFPRSLQSPAQ